MIELLNLTKQYGNTWAVRDLNVTFPDGAITALLGPSGCGKTTTLRMINRLIEPTSGQVLLNGQDTRDLRPEVLRRGIGYVIQQIGLFPHLTVAQNIATVPDLLRHDKQVTARRVDDLLTLVGLDPVTFRNKRPAQLSGGQAQRVGVARALAADPPVLLMDEPFGALDPIGREALQTAFRQIQQQLHKTVVMVTHDIDEALRMADYIALMNAGQLEQFGPPGDLVFRPATPFVSQFLGEDIVLRQLAAVPVERFMQHASATDLPVIPASLPARTALSVMLQENTSALNIEQNGQVIGTVTWDDLRRGHA